LDFLCAKRRLQAALTPPAHCWYTLSHPAPGIEVSVEERTMAAALTCDQYAALLPGYILSALEVAEAATVAEHLHTCHHCQASLVAYEVVGWIIFTSVPSRPWSIAMATI